jgi:dimethylhistidine N-methyltransferase
MQAPTSTAADLAGDLAPDRSDFLAAVLEGLGNRPKAIPSKYLYDATGSRLFDEITTLDEYYPTRTELTILDRHARDIAGLAGADVTLVEFGSGSGHKVRLLLEALVRPHAYVPVEIAREHLMASASALARDYPALQVRPMHADFTRPIALPDLGPGRRVGFFPGSTIGNFTPADAVTFLRHAAASLGPRAGMVVGVDLRKDAATLHAAYNDRHGVTAAFNLNLLTRINRELGGTFDLASFRHRAVWNAERSRVEMHLVSTRPQRVRIPGAGLEFTMRDGEFIWTESSYKYMPDDLAATLVRAGFTNQQAWTHPTARFALTLAGLSRERSGAMGSPRVSV